MNHEWKNEFDRAHEETLRLLDEFKRMGYAYKIAADIRFTECEYPTWVGLDEEEGVVTLDPTKDEPRCIAHELGHGFHECLRRDYPDWWLSAESEGETFAETIRFFVEQRMDKGTKREWLPKAERSKVVEACDYSLGGPTGFCALLERRCTIRELQQSKAALDESKFSPQYKAAEQEQQRRDIEAVRERLGRRVVVVCRKGGRIKEERRFDSASDSFEEVLAVEQCIGIVVQDTPIGLDLIGKGFVGFLPWEMQPFRDGRGFSEAEKFGFSCPIRVADVVENEQTGITTIFLESS